MNQLKKEKITFEIGDIYRSYSDNRLLGKPYWDAVSNVECDFVLSVNRKTMINESHWNIVELLEQLVKWKTEKLSGSFYYQCIDADGESPLEFRQEGENFRVISRTVNPQTSEKVSKTEVLNFVEELRTQTIRKVKDALDTDLTTIEDLSI